MSPLRCSTQNIHIQYVFMCVCICIYTYLTVYKVVVDSTIKKNKRQIMGKHLKYIHRLQVPKLWVLLAVVAC